MSAYEIVVSLEAIPCTRQLIPPKHIGETLTPAVEESTLWRASGNFGSGAVSKMDIMNDD
jgi:hypothetical protein